MLALGLRHDDREPDMTTLLLIRHGEAHVNQPNPDGTYSLIDRHGLTERGLEQAGQLRDRLVHEGVRPDAVVTSSFKRAQQTAEIVCAALDVEPLVSHEIQEWRPGDDAEVIPVGEATGSWAPHTRRARPRRSPHARFRVAQRVLGKGRSGTHPACRRPR